MAVARGPEAVRAALVEAAAELFATRSNPSVRAIAARAGVNHGLVHHYFESKVELRRAALAHLGMCLARTLRELRSQDPVELARHAAHSLREQPYFVQILARSLLDGSLPEPLQHTFPAFEQIVEAAGGRDEVDATALANGLAVVLGWLVFGPWIRAAAGLDEAEADAALDEGIRRHVHDARRGRTKAGA